MLWLLYFLILRPVDASLAGEEAGESRPPLFENVAATHGLAGTVARKVSFADLNADGYPDIILDGSRLFLNDGGKMFVASDAGASLLTDSRKGDFIQVGDVDNDGLPDLFVGRWVDPLLGGTGDGVRNEIRLAARGQYVLKEDSGVGTTRGNPTSACFLDYDRDGNLDLFVGNSYEDLTPSFSAFPDRLYRGNGDGTFGDVTEAAGLLGTREWGLPSSRKPTYGVTHTDWNNDGWQDLLTLSFGRQWNHLWRNNGDGTFTEVGAETTFDGDDIRHGRYSEEDKEGLPFEAIDELPFRANGNTFDAAVADFDGDGDMDLFLAEITHKWAGDSSDLSMLLVNEGGERGYRFRRDPERIVREHTAVEWNQGDLHAGWLDVDNDGYLDLLIASTSYRDDQILRLFHQKPDHSFEDWTDRLGFRWVNAMQISLADFDRDGATDILVSTSNDGLDPEQQEGRDLAVGLFRNLSALRERNHFLNLRLDGNAIGARVTLFSGEQRLTREVQGGLGFAGHRDDTDCRFGLGKARVVDRIEVRWPDHEQSAEVFRSVKADRFYRLRRGGDLQPVAD